MSALVKRAESPLFVLAALLVAACVALILSHHGVPTVLWALTTAALGGGLGLTQPTSGSATAEFKMPTEAELAEIAKTIGSVIPAVMSELEALEPPASVPGNVVSHPTSVSTVRSTEPPSAS